MAVFVAGCEWWEGEIVDVGKWSGHEWQKNSLGRTNLGSLDRKAQYNASVGESHWRQFPSLSSKIESFRSWVFKFLYWLPSPFTGVTGILAVVRHVLHCVYIISHLTFMSYRQWDDSSGIIIFLGGLSPQLLMLMQPRVYSYLITTLDGQMTSLIHRCMYFVSDWGRWYPLRMLSCTSFLCSHRLFVCSQP